MENRKCNSCGTEVITINQLFCIHCGGEIEQPEQPEQTTKECLRCHGHVNHIRDLQSVNNKLRVENYVLRGKYDEEHSWFYGKEDEFAIDTLLDEVSVVISAKDLKEILKR